MRVSGMPITASLAITRRSQASASSIAPPMQAPWITQIAGFVISSATFQASRIALAERAQVARVRRRGRRARRGPCRRRTSGPCRAGRRSARTSRRRRRAAPRRRRATSSPLKALRFSGRLSTTWRTGPCVSVMTRGIAGSVAWVVRRAMSPRTPIGHDLLERLASFEAVDGPAKQIAKAVRSLKAPTKVDEALAGSWLGHPVHPLLIVVPMGSWISAVLVDWLGGEDAETRRRPARRRRPRGRRADRRHRLRRLGRHRARLGHRAPDRDRPRGLQRDRHRALRRLAGRPRRRRPRPRQAARAGRAGHRRRRRLPRRPPHLRRGRRRQRRRRSRSTRRTGRRCSPTPRWARARCARSTSTASRS